MKRFEPTSAPPDEEEIYRHVLRTTHAFCLEATGVRAHSLFYDSQLMPLYEEFGLQYDSSYMLPFAPGLMPIWKEHNVLELPIYYMDDYDLRRGRTSFSVADLDLDQPGLKVLDFHPNMVFVNVATVRQYNDCKSYYRDPVRLLQARQSGRGVRDLFIDVLDWMASRHVATATLGDLNRAWRQHAEIHEGRPSCV